MTFADIFRKSFLDNFSNGDITATIVIVSMLISTLLALYIFFIYVINTKKTFYSKNFNISLVGITIITTAIILSIQSSIVISLGMVGALSIVRFRTAIKEPLDLMFLFWAISIGIICGANLPMLAILLSLLMTLVLLYLKHIPILNMPMILIINASSLDIEESVVKELNKYSICYKIKSRNISQDSIDITIELKTKQEKELISSIAKLKNITSCSILSNDRSITY